MSVSDNAEAAKTKPKIKTTTRRRHRQHGNPFSLRNPVVMPPFSEIYAKQQPLALDVGFGEGRFLLDLAAQHPEWNVLGFEIRQHLVDQVNADAKERGLTNAHAVLANVNLHLDTLVPDGSVAFVAVNFPDPWFKKRHQKRRVVNPAWLPTLLKKLTPTAEIHAMSDFEPIALQIREVLQAEPLLINMDGNDVFAAESTTGIVTEREVTHTRRGEPIYRMRFGRRRA